MNSEVFVFEKNLLTDLLTTSLVEVVGSLLILILTTFAGMAIFSRRRSIGKRQSQEDSTRAVKHSKRKSLAVKPVSAGDESTEDAHVDPAGTTKSSKGHEVGAADSRSPPAVDEQNLFVPPIPAPTSDSPKSPKRRTSMRQAYRRVFGHTLKKHVQTDDSPEDELKQLRSVVRKYENELEQASNTILLQDKVLSKLERQMKRLSKSSLPAMEIKEVSALDEELTAVLATTNHPSRTAGSDCAESVGSCDGSHDEREKSEPGVPTDAAVVEREADLGEVKRLKQELADLVIEHQSALAGKDTAHNEMKEQLEGDIRNRDEEISRWRGSHEEATSTLDEEKTKVLQLHEELTAAQGRLGQLESELASISNENEELQKKLEEAQQNSANLHAELERIAAEKTELQKRLDEGVAAHEDLMKQFDDQVASHKDLQRQVDEQSSASAELQKQVDEHLNSKAEVQQLLDETVTSRDALQQRLDEHVANTEELQRQLDEHSTSNADLQKTLEEHASAHATELAAAEARISELLMQTKAHEETQTALEQAKSDIEELNKTLETQEARLNAAQARIEELTTEIESHASTAAELEAANVTIADLSQKVNGHEQTKADLLAAQSQITQLSNHIAADQTRHETTRQQLEHMKMMLQSTASELDRNASTKLTKENELAESRKELAAVQEKLSAAEADIEQTRTALYAANKQLEELEQRNSDTEKELLETHASFEEYQQSAEAQLETLGMKLAAAEEMRAHMVQLAKEIEEQRVANGEVQSKLEESHEREVKPEEFAEALDVETVYNGVEEPSNTGQDQVTGAGGETAEGSDLTDVNAGISSKLKVDVNGTEDSSIEQSETAAPSLSSGTAEVEQAEPKDENGAEISADVVHQDVTDEKDEAPVAEEEGAHISETEKGEHNDDPSAIAASAEAIPMQNEHSNAEKADDQELIDEDSAAESTQSGSQDDDHSDRFGPASPTPSQKSVRFADPDHLEKVIPLHDYGFPRTVATMPASSSNGLLEDEASIHEDAAQVNHTDKDSSVQPTTVDEDEVNESENTRNEDQSLHESTEASATTPEADLNEDQDAATKPLVAEELDSEEKSEVESAEATDSHDSEEGEISSEASSEDATVDEPTTPVSANPARSKDEESRIDVREVGADPEADELLEGLPAADHHKEDVGHKIDQKVQVSVHEIMLDPLDDLATDVVPAVA